MDKIALSIDTDLETITVSVSGDSTYICPNVSYASEGELFDYGQGKAIFYCGDMGLVFNNNYDEQIVTIDGQYDQSGYQKEYFCE